MDWSVISKNLENPILTSNVTHRQNAKGANAMDLIILDLNS